jgi:hypothetical protein
MLLFGRWNIVAPLHDALFIPPTSPQQRHHRNTLNQHTITQSPQYTKQTRTKMPPKAIVRTPAEVLQALHDRLDEIAREESAAFEAWAANPGRNDPPRRTAERQQEIDDIQVAIARQHEVIASLEGGGGNEN